nr:MmgE/PrpD family protein [Streptomyces sp. AcE210]
MRPYVHPEIDAEWRRYVTPALVTVRFRDGETVELRVDHPKGHPRNPLTRDELVAKAVDCASFSAVELPAGATERIADKVARLETLQDVDELVRMLS